MSMYFYFIIGYITAVLTLFMASCTFSPLEANSTDLGSSPYNPIYVKIVQD